MRRYDWRSCSPHLWASRIESLDRRMQQLGVCRERDCLGLDRGVHRDPFDVAGAQCAGRMRYPQALSQQELELATEPLASNG